MSVRWHLRELIGKYESISKETLTYDTIRIDTGISTSTLSEIGRGNARRVDLKTLNTLLSYFSKKLGEQLSTNDLLKFSDDGEVQGDD